MSGNRLDSLPAFNRVSVHAVLVSEGEDPGPALAEAGIINPIAIQVVLGDELDLAGGILGDGITPNLTAVLETEHQDDFDASPTSQPDSTASQPDAAQQLGPVTTTLPAAFGLQPLAPVRRRDVAGQGPDPRTGL